MKQHHRVYNIVKGSIAVIAIFSLIIINRAPLAHGDYESEINELNSQIDNKKDAVAKLRDQQRYYQQLLAEKQQEKASLNNQLSILDNKIAEIELDIEGTKLEMEQTELELRSLELEIANKDQQIDQAQGRLSKLIKTIDQQGSKNPLEIILMNDSFSDFLNDIEYLNNISSAVRDELEDLKDLKTSLEEQRQILNHKREQLTELQQVLADKKDNLDQEKQTKNFILEQTQLSESQYQALLADAKKEQEQASAEISKLEKTVRQKLAQLEASRPKSSQGESSNVLIWPVPKNRINAYFHDPDYPFRNVFEHPAIDIRAGQGTPIMAAADGYIAAAKNAGMGYSYIMIVHNNGLATVYGHVSKIVVQEEDYVTAGQLIGYSGGTPGTPGAGKMTTGPHLHFEVRLNGIPVDPLPYLP
ncbi:MAG TPA: peptidoglycan DD-metalloendopeptidase family protein [bacterium]|jgi:murein DD-endopeptidase MepM/ murein hydrolase activator NlpD|nr:MAG: Murein DD-endopeptidase MepM [Parcubacteria group bacterium ADurb.Bin016]HNU89987.1 peptidoglycan DD-metalloendopeptidase family protein [bacterium]HOE81272.1 peptidoglycan DD-metalloendopeptidase family protein [bacterium]HPL83717.1 peptidoglycan DD-metalloendopeptidase family protein [bacterium]HPX64960.1 peptidoglycan DD-metalloendopeptidase family protein [bacterium]